jgi:hypothetical protein
MRNILFPPMPLAKDSRALSTILISAVSLLYLAVSLLYLAVSLLYLAVSFP